MKASKIALAALAALVLVGCSKKGSGAASAKKTDFDSGIKIVKEDGGEYASFDAMKAVFEPDFSYKYVEDPEDEEAVQSEGKKSSKKEKSESAIPGIRELSKYKTKYSEKRQKTSLPKIEEADEKIDSSKPFVIEEYGPQGEVVAEDRNPSFFVVFSQPVKSLGALGEPMAECDEMKVEPALPGVYRWLGSRHLSFDASEAADPSVEYKVTVKKGLRSLAGKKLEGMTEFTTKAVPLKFIRFYGGYVKDSESACDSTSGALPKYAARSYIRLNYMVSQKRLSEILNVTVNGKAADFTVQADDNKKAYPWGAKPVFDKATEKANSFVVTITSQIPYDADIVLSLKGTNEKRSYHSLKPFKIASLPKNADYSQGTEANPVTIKFTQKIDPATVAANIAFDFDFSLTEKNYEVQGRRLTLFNLPVSYSEDKEDNSFRIYFKDGLKDVYGQKLVIDSDKKSAKIGLLPPMSYVKFTDYGARLLEAQFKPKLWIESQNILSPSFYKVGRTSNPLFTDRVYEDWNQSDGLPEGAVELVNKQRNVRQFEEIDLSPLLNGEGYGWIDFEARVLNRQWDRWDEKFYDNANSRKITIQVTDFGVTARIGINRAVVMARSLRDNSPIQDAEISLLTPSYSNSQELDLDKDLVAKAKTDKNGLAVINFTESQVKKIEEIGRDVSCSYIRILAQKGADKALFYPNTHDSWRENVPTADLDTARQSRIRAFIFTDRGLYKPGETVSFRGIVRNQSLGQLVPRSNEPYTLAICEGGWEGKEILPQIDGTLSESGGFYGSFKLPDELDSGYYKIRYKGGKYEWDDPYATFTVANFERLKFEASVTAPDITRFGGDKISANLKASYLAGGSLAGADYETSWFKQSTRFKPTTSETKGYTFGPSDSYSGRTLFANEKGVLSSNGEAGLSCSSEKITDGMPYIYHVEANVTDISNQRISAQSNILVHPAKFYVGIKKPAELNGFAKKGSKLDFPFILATPDGQIVTKTNIVASLEYKLTREVWTMANEQSVDDSIYTRWEKTEEVEASGRMDVQAAGKLSLELKEAGWRTLSISGRDTSGNWTTTEYGFYVTGGSSSWHDRYNSHSINLTPDKSVYNPGDKAQILMESPLPAGDYLITVEREGIFTEEVQHFDTAATVIEVPVSINYTPVVYVAVSSYSCRNGQPTHQYGEPDLDKPAGYFGVTPIMVNPKAKSFNVKIESDKKVYRPGEKATLTLTATKGGKPVEGAELTVMAVDRGVLDLINYHVPNPIDFFYDKNNFRLHVMGGDSRDMLMDPVTYSVKNLLGGDAAAESDEKEDERKDFRPTALFEPVIVTDKKGKAVCEFTMPDNLTAYRITAFGVKGETFSLKEDEVKVQNPINVQQVQPRRLRERDTAECGVLITNLDSKGQKVTVSVEAASPTKNTAQDELEGRVTVPGKAFVDGTAEKTVYVAPEGSSVVFFDIAAVQSGTVELLYKIKSEALNEKLVSPIAIEKTFVYETVTMTGATDDEPRSSESELIAIPGWAKEGQGEIKITLDTSRLGPLGSAVRYVFDYPYGCLEQQASKVLPLLIFGQYIDAFEMNSSVSNPKKCALSIIKSWAKSQHSNGGFPYWPNESIYESLYVSLRIAQVCAAAKEAGLKESDLKLDLAALKSYIKEQVRKPETSGAEKILACKVFAALGDSSLDGLLLEFQSKLEKLSLSQIADIGKAWSLKGDKARAEACAAKIRPYLQASQRSVSVAQKDSAKGYAWWESDSSRLAKILDLLTDINAGDNMVDRLIFALLKEESKGYWKNTSSTASVLEAMANYIKRRDLAKTDLEGKAFLNKTELMAQKFKGVAAKPETLSLPFDDAFISSLPRDKELPIAFEKRGTGRLFYTVEMKYALPDEAQTRRDEGIKIDYKIVESEGESQVNAIPDDLSLVELESSKLYKATVKVSSTRNRDYLALRCPIPSGAEILDSTFVTSGDAARIKTSGDWRHWISNKNVRDNEIQFFWDSFKTGECEITFTFRASRRGVYPTPPVQAECMYEPEVFGRSDGCLFVIK
ncbi:MAG: MG2 domain-containing protein [Treponema sp.]|nr:MG2 domain-containing protein [Treponema sp.]